MQEAQGPEAHVSANRAAYRRVRDIAAGADDRPVLMLNLNTYHESAGFPAGEAYVDYMRSLDHAVVAGGGRVLWRAPVSDLVIGCDHDDYDEVLAVWYPSHAAFVDLPNADGAERMFEGRTACVANATILSLPADREHLSPEGSPSS